MVPLLERRLLLISSEGRPSLKCRAAGTVNVNARCTCHVIKDLNSYGTHSAVGVDSLTLSHTMGSSRIGIVIGGPA